MPVRKTQVAKLIKAAERYSEIAQDNGWRATRASDRAANVFSAARRNSTKEEIAEFERFYTDK